MLAVTREGALPVLTAFILFLMSVRVSVATMLTTFPAIRISPAIERAVSVDVKAEEEIFSAWASRFTLRLNVPDAAAESVETESRSAAAVPVLEARAVRKTSKAVEDDRAAADVLRASSFVLTPCHPVSLFSYSVFLPETRSTRWCSKAISCSTMPDQSKPLLKPLTRLVLTAMKHPPGPGLPGLRRGSPDAGFRLFRRRSLPFSIGKECLKL
ncbi:MAG: hypothetical protein A4E73_00687 [Syntrophaceae bacterium PtaU1.Bin231]|nr:MAG: hypothetical protein A4E73_00687 [Syntrophaceae bacterium PtaU1.Bin231]